MRKRLTKFINQKGFTVIEVMVAAMVMGIVSLALVNMQGGQQRMMKGIEMKSNVNRVFTEVRRIMSKKASCTATLAPLGLTRGNAGPIAIPTFFIAERNVIGAVTADDFTEENLDQGAATRARFSVDGATPTDCSPLMAAADCQRQKNRFVMTAATLVREGTDQTYSLAVQVDINPANNNAATRSSGMSAASTWTRVFSVNVRWDANGNFTDCNMDVDYNDDIVTNACQLDPAITDVAVQNQWIELLDADGDNELECVHHPPPGCNAFPASYFRGWRADGTAICKQRGDLDFTAPWPAGANNTHAMFSLNADGTYNAFRLEGYCAGQTEVVKGWSPTGGLAGDGGFNCLDLRVLIDKLPGHSTAGSEVLVNDGTRTARWMDINCPLGWGFSGLNPDGTKICTPTMFDVCGVDEYISSIDVDGSVKCELVPVDFAAADPGVGNENRYILGLNPDGSWNYASPVGNCPGVWDAVGYDNATDMWECHDLTPPNSDAIAAGVCPFFENYRWNGGRNGGAGKCEKTFGAAVTTGNVLRGYDGNDAGEIEVCDADGWKRVASYTGSIPTGRIVVMAWVTSKTDDAEGTDSHSFVIASNKGQHFGGRVQWYEHARNPGGGGEESGHTWTADTNVLVEYFDNRDSSFTAFYVEANEEAGGCAWVAGRSKFLIFAL
jgi:prepilin-type N-terminal cleavage/methylation domain-containing protein